MYYFCHKKWRIVTGARVEARSGPREAEQPARPADQRLDHGHSRDKPFRDTNMAKHLSLTVSPAFAKTCIAEIFRIRFAPIQPRGDVFLKLGTIRQPPHECE